MSSAATARALQRTPGKVFLLRLALGTLVLIVAAWLFGTLAEDVVNKDAPLGSIDLAISIPPFLAAGALPVPGRWPRRGRHGTARIPAVGP